MSTSDDSQRRTWVRPELKAQGAELTASEVSNQSDLSVGAGQYSVVT